MLVRIMEEFFGTELYDLTLGEGELLLRNPDREEISIPYGDLKSVSLEGNDGKLRRFLLESRNKTYEGSFLEDHDAEAFISKMRKQRGFYIDVRLDALEQR